MLMRTDPFRDFDRLTQQVFGTAARAAAMPFDAYRTGDEFVIHFDLPGVDPGSIDLTVEKNVLTVHAERQRQVGDDVELVVGERPQGSFSRQLFLGDTLDSDAIDASYVDGVLTLRIPIAEKAKPRRVEIRAEGGRSEIGAPPSEERVPAGT
jgi:HSP20 family protein